MTMIKVLGNKVSNVFKEVNKRTRNIDCSAFLVAPYVGLKETIEGDEVAIYIHSGNNEGYYICIATIKDNIQKLYFLFRFHTDLESVIEVHNLLLKILEV